MRGLSLTLTILASVGFYMISDPISPDEVINTTCTFTEINKSETLYVKSSHPVILYDYNLTIEIAKNHSTIHLNYHHMTSEDINQDINLINKTIPCYLVRDKLAFEYPKICDSQCATAERIMYTLLFLFIGIMFEFMHYKRLTL